ncbi:MAG: type I 3-dehydroquinate dehydratase, partial [Acidobacteria bacterium]|nr:type I 3-dehydroquinate dehydratase [Acidobacteriota bacterium]
MARLDFFPRICVALGFADAEALAQHAHREAEAGETFFEFRLDYLERPEQGVKLIKSFLQRHADCTVLATCRRRPNLGRFAGNLEEQFRVLEAAVKAGAGAVDIEVE